MANIVEIKTNSFRFKTDKKFLTSALRKEGTAIARDARLLIRKAAGGGRVYGDHVASAPHNPPATLTGLLAKSIGVRNRRIRNGLSVSIRDNAPYALFLEQGTKGGGPGGKRKTAHKKGQTQPVGNRVQEPRPFLSMALNRQISGGMERRLEDAVMRDLS